MTSPKSKTSIGQIIILCLFGIGFAVAMLLLLLNLFPNLLPSRENRREAGLTLDVSFRYTDGDMWVHQQGRIKPPEEDVLLAQWTMAWDENGFRVPEQLADSYPIAAFGDSFTEATTVPHAWTDRLAEALAVPVRNYGYRGYGPHEIANTAQNFADEDPRTWVLYAHFSGNDLANANRALREDLVARSPLGRLEWLVRQASDNQDLKVEIVEREVYDYPMPVIIGGSYYEQVFLEDLLWWQVAPEGGFLGTKTLESVGDALDTISSKVSPETCRAVIFIPSKEQIYYRYIHPASRQYFNVAFQQTVITTDNEVILEPAELPRDAVDAYIERLGEQRDAIQTLAAEQGWIFIDLLPAFELAAFQEQMLYYEYDGHWNQAGHDLAAQVIAEAMQATPNCPLGF